MNSSSDNSDQSDDEDRNKDKLASDGLAFLGGDADCKPAVANPDHYFFEGAEKLLEVWFTRESGGDDDGEGCDLRRIPR